MAKLKAEFLQHYWDQHGVPARALAVGQVAAVNRLAGKLPGLSNRILRGSVLGRLTKWLMGVHPKRQLPALAEQSFAAWWRQRRGATRGQGSKVVALYIDEFTDANAPEIGRDAVEVLKAMGYEVVVPPTVESGRPMISKGLLRQARRKAVANLRTLWPLADDDVPILGLEPSAALTLVDEYPELVPGRLRERAAKVAEQTQLFTDFIAQEAKSRSDLADLFDDEERALYYHGHCHEKALVGVDGALAALALPTGHRVTLIESTCCGMAGSFGYEHYDLSMEIGELALFPAVRQTQESDLIVTQGFSCRHQIEDGTSRRALHPAQVLRLALRA
jgi:Fe-S oxidoreductase